MALLGAQFVNAVSPNPVGSLQAYAGASAPTGWLPCDGGQTLITAYPELYSVLGTTYGALTNGSGGAGTTHFRVPDLRGRMPIGAGNEGVAANNTPTGRALGTKGGDTRMQSHTHTSSVGSGNFAVPNMGIGWANSAPAAGWNPSNLIGSLNNAGSGGAENMPPFLVTNYIIKAVPDAPRSGLAYGSTPPIVTQLPANPQFGDVVTYIADATNGVAWDLQYDATGTYPWKFIGGSPLYASAGGDFSTPATGSTTNYVNSGLSGSPTITIPLPGDYMGAVTANTKLSNSSVAPGLFLSFNGSAPGNWPGADCLSAGGAASAYPLAAQKLGTLTAASQTLSIVWCNANIAGSLQAYLVRLTATPVRVKAP